jgi:hypothetical protein
MMMKIDFDPIEHKYKIDGKPTPSVTQILGLANLYEFIDKQLLDKAGRFGTAVHKATELFDQDRLNMETLDVALIPYLEGWKMFLTESKFSILQSENIVGSSFGYAGAYDRVGYLNDQLTMLEIKTTAAVPRTTRLQLAAYKHAYEEMTGLIIKQRLCVRIKPLGYSMDIFQGQQEDFWMFCKFLDVYKWSHKYD